MSHSEPQFEALLQRAYPGYEAQIQGCSPDEIAAIEQLCPVPLPVFYRWFLERFGRDPGPLAYPYTDLRASAVLEFYAQEFDGTKLTLAQGLIIGCSTDPMWSHLSYDLRYPARDDARVRLFSLGKETLREMLAWGVFLSGILPTFEQTGGGVIAANTESVLDDVTEVMLRLGFEQPLPTGNRTRFFTATDAALMLDGDFDSNSALAFHVGAGTATRIREILGLLCTEVNMEIWKLEWQPPLDAGT
jgi:hypothetical protein